MDLVDDFSKSSDNMVATRQTPPKTGVTENQDSRANAGSASNAAVTDPAVLEAIKESVSHSQICFSHLPSLW